ncbi:MAG: hypothetical protein R6U96_18720 [Promethearchaeia archaeon]
MNGYINAHIRVKNRNTNKSLKLKSVLFLFIITLCITETAVLLAIGADTDYPDFEVDLNRESDYSEQFSWKNISIDYGNDANYHYFFVESKDENITSGSFGNEDTEYNISSNTNNMFVYSKINNDTLEMQADRDHFGNKVFLEINQMRFIMQLDPFVPEAPAEEDADEETTDESEEDEAKDRSVSFEVFLMALIFFSNITWATVVLIMKARRKVYIEAYKVKENEKGELVRSKELEVLGEVKNIEKPDFDPNRGLYIYEMRSGVKRFNLYSMVSMEDYKNKHLIKNYLWIRYLLNAYMDEKRVDAKEEQVGYSVPVKLARFVIKMFEWSFHGIPLQLCIYLGILLLSGVHFLIALTVSVPMSLIIAAILYAIDSKVNFKKKTKTVKKEKHLNPMETKFEVIDVYEVDGEELIETELEDGTKEQNWKPFHNKRVEAYEKLVEMRQSETIRIDKKSIEKIGQTHKERDQLKIEDLRKSYIARNKHLTELILEQRSQINEKNKRIQQLEKEKQLAKESIRQENAETMKEIDRALDKKWGGIKKYFVDMFGDIAKEDFAGEMKRLVEARAKAEGKDIDMDVRQIKQMLVQLYEQQQQNGTPIDLNLKKLVDFERKQAKKQGEKANG